MIAQMAIDKTTKKKSSTQNKQKTNLHPRNYHRSPYDFQQLISVEPALSNYLKTNDYGNLSIDFSNPNAVITLNKALLNYFYQIQFWNIPQGYLCPPIPGRADYIHYIADLLANTNGGAIPKGANIRGLDIGVGANCVYPIVGHSVYGWQFVGSDIDNVSIKSAKLIVNNNTNLKGNISIRQQQSTNNIFMGLILDDDRFDFTLCNPPFHSSKQQAQQGTYRKLTNLAANSTKKLGLKQQPNNAKSQSGNNLNFGGQSNELWCAGGELAFIQKIIEQSVEVSSQCLWFTTLVSKKENLKAIYKLLKKANAKEVKTVNMAQGQKQSRFVAWTFLSTEQQAEWKNQFWK